MFNEFKNRIIASREAQKAFLQRRSLKFYGHFGSEKVKSRHEFPMNQSRRNKRVAAAAIIVHVLWLINASEHISNKKKLKRYEWNAISYTVTM